MGDWIALIIGLVIIFGFGFVIGPVLIFAGTMGLFIDGFERSTAISMIVGGIIIALPWFLFWLDDIDSGGGSYNYGRRHDD